MSGVSEFEPLPIVSEPSAGFCHTKSSHRGRSLTAERSTANGGVQHSERRSVAQRTAVLADGPMIRSVAMLRWATGQGDCRA